MDHKECGLGRRDWGRNTNAHSRVNMLSMTAVKRHVTETAVSSSLPSHPVTPSDHHAVTLT